MRLLSDFSLAVITIWAEARGQSFAGKIAVGNVIRNRMAKHGVGAGVVVMQHAQFSCWLTSDPNYLPMHFLDDVDAVVKDCANAWIASGEQDLVGGATLYANLKTCTPSWISSPLVQQVAVIDDHTFFTEGAPPAA